MAWKKKAIWRQVAGIVKARRFQPGAEPVGASERGPTCNQSLLEGHPGRQLLAARLRCYKRYFSRLVGLARTRLCNLSRRVQDEEDVALSALNSFFRGVDKGRFPNLEDANDLWQILMVLTERKAVNQFRREHAAKRGGGRVRGDSHFAARAGVEAPSGWDAVAGEEPTPELAAMFTEECRRLFNALQEPELRVVALLKMEGFTNDEIARSLDRVPRSIERKLRTIRTIWLGEAGREGDGDASDTPEGATG